MAKVIAAIARCKGPWLATLSILTPTGTPNMPPMVSGKADLSRIWLRVCTRTIPTTNAPKALHVITVVHGSCISSKIGLATVPIPKLTVPMTVLAARIAKNEIAIWKTGSKYAPYSDSVRLGGIVKSRVFLTKVEGSHMATFY